MVDKILQAIPAKNWYEVKSLYSGDSPMRGLSRHVWGHDSCFRTSWLIDVNCPLRILRLAPFAVRGSAVRRGGMLAPQKCTFGKLNSL